MVRAIVRQYNEWRIECHSLAGSKDLKLSVASEPNGSERLAKPN